MLHTTQITSIALTTNFALCSARSVFANTPCPPPLLRLLFGALGDTAFATVSNHAEVGVAFSIDAQHVS